MEDYKQTLYNDELLNILPDGVIIFDTNGEVIQLNQQALAELHVHPSVNEMLPFPTDHLFKLINKGEDILPIILEKIHQGENTYSLPEHTFIQEQVDYTQFPIRGEFATIRDENNLYKVLFFFRNITVELTQEYILNTALQRTRIYPWYYDISRSEFTLDDRYFEHLGIPAGEDNTLTMEEYVNMIHPDDRQAMADAFVVQLSGNTTFDKAVSFRLHRGDGTWEWFEGQSTYIANISGHPYRLVGICLSIQEYKDIENTLIEARKKAEESDRLKMAFLANMSHEIRTPLNAIVGFSGLIVNEKDENKRNKYVQVIESNNELLLKLIGDILDLSKVEAGSMEYTHSEFDLNKLMEDMNGTLQLRLDKKKQVVLSYKCGLEQCVIRSERNRLTQLVTNLVTNAIKFTEHGTINFGYELRNDMLRFYVSDTGCGIPKEKQKDIFNRFIKLNDFKQGFGLGLPICKSIVNDLGGEIGVESEEGKGSTFWFTIPYVPVEKTVKTDAPVRITVASPSAKSNILVAEDNESNYELVSAILSDDYNLFHAWNGRQAIEMFKECNPQLILMDINMPEMDGYEATRAIRKLSTDIPILALTAYAYASDEERILASGMNAYMSKPVNAQQLCIRIDSLLNGNVT